MRQFALITGASGGLGRAFAWEFAAQGWDLLLTDLSAEALRLLAGGIEWAHGVRTAVRECDLADDAQVRGLAAWVRDRDEPLGAIVNVAGFDVEGSFLERDPVRLLALMRVNMEGGVILMHELASRHCNWQPLRVINTSSLAAYYPMPYKALYAASKAFVLNASLALREEFRGRATVTVLCPAGMPTTASCLEAVDAQGVIGRLTTRNTSDVVRQTYRAAIQGHAVVVPGAINRLMLGLSRIVPTQTLAWLIGGRWAAARARGTGDGRQWAPVRGAPALAMEGADNATGRSVS